MDRIGPGAAVGVVGAGIMGAGIAQVAALAGHPVQLFDTREGAAEQARQRLQSTFDGLVGKGRLDASQASAAIARIAPAASLRELCGCAVVVEAIVEQLPAKRGLFHFAEENISHMCH